MNEIIERQVASDETQAQPLNEKHSNATSKQDVFVVDEASEIIKSVVDSVLQSCVYDQSLVSIWTNDIIDNVLRRLMSLNKPFKFVANCVIMQRNGAGLHTASSCLWDEETDGSCIFRWENKTMFCIVSVYGLAI
ncbi:hypothetical protein GJ496_002351 [Pomphorhynchus laevis]|nr:hypothetical protein GJ496_002351 [Pomphorhynchus laevis]